MYEESLSSLTANKEKLHDHQGLDECSTGTIGVVYLTIHAFPVLLKNRVNKISKVCKRQVEILTPITSVSLHFCTPFKTSGMLWLNLRTGSAKNQHYAMRICVASLCDKQFEITQKNSIEKAIKLGSFCCQCLKGVWSVKQEKKFLTPLGVIPSVSPL